MPTGELSEWKNKGKSWFFGIGINTYLEFPNLTNAVRDIEDIKAVLESLYDIDLDHTITLFDEEANEENIIEKLDTLGKNVGPNDKLIIYYSGHGRVNNDINIGYWIPHDGKESSSSRYILNSTIRDYVGGIDAKHILLFSDACFSGSIFMRGNFRSADLADELSDRPSRWALCSGRQDEVVYDGDPGAHSPFAQSLLNILTTSKAEYIPISRIVNHVIEETASNYEQLPDGRPMYGVGHGGGQYIFRKKDAPVRNTVAESTDHKVSAHTTDEGSTISSEQVSTSTIGTQDTKFVKSVGFIILGAFLIMAVMFITIFYLASKWGDEDPIQENIENQVEDRDGELYSTITIGNTEWMALNMNYVSENETDWSLLNDLDAVESRQLGQLYSYAGAVEACEGLRGGGWTLPSVQDWELLAANLGYPLLPINEGQAHTFQNPLAAKLITGGSSGLNLQFGGKYYIDSKEFTPSSFLKLNNGHYWTQGKRIMNITQYAKETVADITSPVPWNHACSCRCVKNN